MLLWSRFVNATIHNKTALKQILFCLSRRITARNYRKESGFTNEEEFERENELLFGPLLDPSFIKSRSYYNKLQLTKESNNFEAVLQSKLPSTREVKTASTNIEDSGVRSFQTNLLFPYIFQDNSEKHYELCSTLLSSSTSASVSKILNATMSEKSRAALDRWRKEKIKELGEAGFLAYQNFLFSRGKALHKSIFDYLSGEIPLEDLVITKENEGHWNSLQHILQKVAEPSILEKTVVHPYLKYHGIVDCVCKLNGVVTVLDWKTSERRKPDIEYLYDNPIQVAAYIGAVNFDPAFEKQDLCKGAVVVVYESGTPADIFTFNPEKYWNIWLEKLTMFHNSSG